MVWKRKKNGVAPPAVALFVFVLVAAGMNAAGKEISYHTLDGIRPVTLDKDS